MESSPFIEGKYEILGKIREGGMGSIYKVRHRLLDEVRVIKVMKPQVLADEDLRKRFVEEAKTATRLKHPNICTIHDFSVDPDGTGYLVMEFIDGVTLAELGRSATPVSVPMTLEIARQSLLALGYLHRRNVVHRDIAPDNLMLTSDEEGNPVIKLIDLGIAKALDRPGDLTSTGVFLGKLKYASPEQYGALPPGEKIDGRSDLYCLGLVLYELLTGARPFVGETPAEMIRAHLFQPPKPFVESDPEGRVSAELRAVVLKALEKRREDRFLTAEDFLREITAVKGHDSPLGDADSTQIFVSNVRKTQQVTGVGVTPSAQGRLDRRFGVHSTPHPIRSTGTGPESETWNTPTTIDSVPAQPTPRSPSTSPAPSRSSSASRSTSVQAPSRPVRWPVVLGAVLLAAAGAAILVAVRSSGRSPGAAPAPAASSAPLESGLATPSAASSAETSPVPPTEVPLAAAIVPTEPPPPVEARPTSAPVSRPRPTPEPLRRTPVSRIARNEAQTPPFAAAAPPVATPQPAIAVPTAAPPPPTQRPTPTVAASAPMSTSSSAAEVPRAGSADADRIREVLRTYERAHNTLDVDLYERVFPTFVSQQRQNLDRAWRGLKSQHLDLEVRQVDIKGNQAVVHAFQRLEAVPQAGEGQRDSREVVLKLEKRGDNWVITGRS